MFLQFHYKHWYISNGLATLRVGLEMVVYMLRVGESRCRRPGATCLTFQTGGTFSETSRLNESLHDFR